MTRKTLKNKPLDHCKDCLNKEVEKTKKGGICKVQKAEDVCCDDFQPNVFDLAQYTQTNLLSMLATVLNGVDSSKLSLLASVVRKEKLTRKYGYYFFQPVYYKFRDEDYVSNFVKARILYADSKCVCLTDENFELQLVLEGGQKETKGPNIWTEENFYRLRQRLLRNKKELDPMLDILNKDGLKSLEELVDLDDNPKVRRHTPKPADLLRILKNLEAWHEDKEEEYAPYKPIVKEPDSENLEQNATVFQIRR